MLGVSSKVDKVVYALCTDITITSSRGMTMYTFVAPDRIPYSMVYYHVQYKVFAHYGQFIFNEIGFINWLRRLADKERNEN